MFVIKRDGKHVPIRYDSITDRNIEYGKELDVDVAYLSQLVINSLKSGMTTSQIDDLSAETAFYLSCYNPDYDILATKISVSNLHKSTKSDFASIVNDLFTQINHESGKSLSLISEEFHTFVQANAEELQAMIDFNRDWLFTYFGLQTMKKMYLLRMNKKIVERPQHMFLRVAVAIHYSMDEPKQETLQKIKTSYDLMSQHKFTHASPTLFNAGNPRGNLSSCFLLHTDDSLAHIFQTVSNCAMISKTGGGIGVNISSVRAKGATIHTSGGKSDGIVPLAQVFNATARYSSQSGRRAGSFALYLEPSHPDVIDFLHLRLPSPPEELRARDIFLAMWVSDLFMQRVENDEMWSLMCPAKVPEIYDTFGKEYEKAYKQAEQQQRYERQVPAREIWKAILQSQQETGLPYILYKDAINRKSNQANIGLIRSSNLCVSGDTQILTLTDGWQPIESLAAKSVKVKVWNGFQYVEVTPAKTNDAAELVLVTLSNGVRIKCTKYHKFPLQSHKAPKRMVEAKDLQAGDTLIRYMLPVSPISSDETNDDTSDDVPSSVSSPECKRLWLREQILKQPQQHENKLVAPSYEWAKQVRLMLQTIAIDSAILCVKDQWILQLYPANESCTVKVVSVSVIDGTHPTYCFHDTTQNLGMFDGVCLGNCAEIVEYSDAESCANCNLASIALHKFVKYDATNKPYYDYDELGMVVQVAVENLNKVIDRTQYPIEIAKQNNLSYRPIGLGVQGLADVFALFKTEWGSTLSATLNRNIFATIYYHAVKCSNDLAKLHGSYSKFEGSPASQGQLQPHLWGMTTETLVSSTPPAEKWRGLIDDVKQFGLRNSLLVALMPTASTSQTLGSNECFEPFTSNIYTRSTDSGEFIIINKYLYRDLKELGLWSKELVDQIIQAGGSVQNLAIIPTPIRKRYKTVWEISQKIVIDFAAQRGPFVDQTQSMNLFVERPTYKVLSTMHMYAWKQGLKTGSYYVRSRPARDAVKFTVSSTTSALKAASVDEPCLMCSS